MQLSKQQAKAHIAAVEDAADAGCGLCGGTGRMSDPHLFGAFVPCPAGCPRVSAPVTLLGAPSERSQVSDLMAEYMKIALTKSEEVLEGAVTAFLAEHGHYPRFGWIAIELDTDFRKVHVIGYAADEVPADVPEATAIVCFDSLNESQIDE